MRKICFLALEGLHFPNEAAVNSIRLREKNIKCNTSLKDEPFSKYIEVIDNIVYIKLYLY